MSVKRASIQLEYDKETAGTWRYKEIVPRGEVPVVVTMYFRKEGFQKRFGGSASQPPQALTVTVENLQGGAWPLPGASGETA